MNADSNHEATTSDNPCCAGCDALEAPFQVGLSFYCRDCAAPAGAREDERPEVAE